MKVPQKVFVVTDESYRDDCDSDGGGPEKRFDETIEQYYFSTKEKANKFLENLVDEDIGRDRVFYDKKGFAKVEE